MEIELTRDQKKACDEILDFVTSGDKLMTLGGYAGTGKTTLIGEASKTLKNNGKKIAFCTFSGKASTVLRKKLVGIMDHKDYCGTIHSLIYILVGKEVKQEKTKLYFDFKEDNKIELEYDLIIIDEASMINKYVFEDLSSFGIPILAVGDHGQLPPVEGNFNLMQDPQIRLESIMRQAEHNPIIKLSMIARKEGKLVFEENEHVQRIRNLYAFINKENYDTADSIILCAKNDTRVRTNAIVREKFGITDPCPVPGEPVICLKNNRRERIYNGNIGTLNDIHEIDGKNYNVRVDMGDFFFNGDILAKQFGQKYLVEEEAGFEMFDWGYVITTHKSQGSEWGTVILIEERMMRQGDDNWRRWLYTAVTRAKERLFVVKR